MHLCRAKTIIRTDGCARMGHLSLLAHDLASNPTDLSEKLAALHFNFNLYTIVLAEVSLTYVPVSAVDSLLRWINYRIEHCRVIIYEQIRPNDR